MRATTKRTRRTAGKGVILLSLAAFALPGAPLRAGHDVTVLVQGTSSSAAAIAVRHAGGSVTTELSVVDGVVATVPADAVDVLRHQPEVTGVAQDASGSLESVLPGTTYDTETQGGSMYSTARLVGANTLWGQGYTGTNIGVALIDSGVQPSAFFGTRLVAGTDVTGGGNALVDGFGHGTHLAGIIAGQSGAIGAAGSFTGIAPSAKLVSVKVADAQGASSLTRILQGLDWVYRNKVAFNIKVANLSMGVPAYDDYAADPLSAAVERLWNNGVTVVASAGNIGQGHNLTSPAYDPSIIAVGGLDTKGTVDKADDVPAVFSATGADWLSRTPDVLAPARSIQSVKATGSYLAGVAPASSRVGATFMKGSGTSQAAAVVTGEVALLLSARSMSPNDVKWNIRNLTVDGPWDQLLQGAGITRMPTTFNRLNLLVGLGLQFNLPAWVSATSANDQNDTQYRSGSWQGSTWQGSTWQGSTWQGSSWQGSTWSGSTWQGSVWMSMPS